MAYLLTLVTFLPAVGAVLVLLLPRRQEGVTKLVTLGATLVTFVISLPVYFRFDATSAVPVLRNIDTCSGASLTKIRPTGILQSSRPQPAREIAAGRFAACPVSKYICGRG